MKQVQIPQELFVKLIRYFFCDELELDVDLEELEREIKFDIRKKLDKISMRGYYTAYKTAPTEQEREEARKKYLDERGVPESFRW